MSKSKYEPHQGKQEIERRRLQILAALLCSSGTKLGPPSRGVVLTTEERETDG